MIDPTLHLDILNDPNATSSDKLAAIDEMNESGYTWWVSNDGESVGLIDWETKMRLMATCSDDE